MRFDPLLLNGTWGLISTLRYSLRYKLYNKYIIIDLQICPFCCLYYLYQPNLLFIFLFRIIALLNHLSITISIIRSILKPHYLMFDFVLIELPTQHKSK